MENNAQEVAITAAFMQDSPWNMSLFPARQVTERVTIHTVNITTRQNARVKDNRREWWPGGNILAIDKARLVRHVLRTSVRLLE